MFVRMISDYSFSDTSSRLCFGAKKREKMKKEGSFEFKSQNFDRSFTETSQKLTEQQEKVLNAVTNEIVRMLKEALKETLKEPPIND